MFTESKKELEIIGMLINRSKNELSVEGNFTSRFRKDIISVLKGRMILTLIEFAHLHPTESNHVSLCKKLDIPPSTLSNQIKKLVKLDYLENSISPKNLYDARYRNYRITIKGISFLHMLREVLNLSIKRVEELKSLEQFKESLDEKLHTVYV